MIEEKDSYSRDEVQQLLRWQYISIRNEMMRSRIFADYDFDEKICVGEVNKEIRSITFTICDISKTCYEYKFEEKK